ncbi:MAG: LysM peptidoglycan-binding domain-containing protein [Thermoleophilia bacterium]|nr:LysM peptidoglycan-binding domain-containing protein [Thermoleophilia bacterium]
MRPPATTAVETAEPPTGTTATETTATTAGRFYRVRAGDTLESIASQNGTTVERLLELNPGIDPVALRIGQRIRVG